MAQTNEFYAFIVSPSAKSKLRKVRISYTYVKWAAAAAALVAIVGIVGAIRLAQHAALEASLASLRTENDELRRQNDAFRASYDRLNGRLSYVEDMSESLAREVKHEPTPEVDLQVGEGGPAAN